MMIGALLLLIFIIFVYIIDKFNLFYMYFARREDVKIYKKAKL